MWGDHTFSDQRTPRDNFLISLLTFGEGFHCFHHEFPYDFRNGILWYHYDPTKWLIRLASYVGLTYDLKEFPIETIEKGRLQMLQKKLDQRKSKYDWGPTISELPTMTERTFDQHVEGGATLLIIDNVVHDVTKFVDKHPAGPALIRAYVGKDATHAFNGGSYNHSHAARNILACHRIARLDEKKEKR